MGSKTSTRETFANMSFAKIYPMYLQKIEKKGRDKKELHQVIGWLTGFDDKMLQVLIEGDANFETFFEHASLHANAGQITGVICGYRVEEIEDELIRKVRYLDKLVDELAKGRAMEKILRGS